MPSTRTRLTGAALGVALLVPAAALAADIQGGPGGERLKGTNGADTIDGNGGNDRIRGLAGDDRLTGGLGNDRVFGNAGNDAISGVQGNDRLVGGTGNDAISGDGNDVGDRTSFDRIWGNRGNDVLRGGDSRDRIHGGNDDDKSFGESGNDIMSGGTGNDEQHGGAGNDRIYANRGVDVTFGGPGNDVLWALARGDVDPNGVDTIADSLDGGEGNDRFRTRDGEVDRITCGPGRDVARLDHRDLITDATMANPKGSCEVVTRNPRPDSSREADGQSNPPSPTS